MNTEYLIAITSIILLIIVCAILIMWRVEKNSSIISQELDEESRHNEENLEVMNKHVIETKELLETYKKTIEEKSSELKKYKEGADIAKTKGLFISLVEILGFVDQFKKKSKNLDEQTINYIDAIKDKIEIVLTNFGVEIFKPELNQNVLGVTGCSSSLETKKTKDPAKVNLIASVIKPGYRLQVKENEFISLKNAEVQVYELEN